MNTGIFVFMYIFSGPVYILRWNPQKYLIWLRTFLSDKYPSLRTKDWLLLHYFSDYCVFVLLYFNSVLLSSVVFSGVESCTQHCFISTSLF